MCLFLALELYTNFVSILMSIRNEMKANMLLRCVHRYRHRCYSFFFRQGIQHELNTQRNVIISETHKHCDNVTSMLTRHILNARMYLHVCYFVEGSVSILFPRKPFSMRLDRELLRFKKPYQCFCLCYFNTQANWFCNFNNPDVLRVCVCVYWSDCILCRDTVSFFPSIYAFKSPWETEFGFSITFFLCIWFDRICSI